MTSISEESLEDQVKRLYVECNELKRQLNENEFLHDNRVEDLKLEMDEQKRTIVELSRSLKAAKSEMDDMVDSEKYSRLEQQLDEESRKTESLVFLNDKYERIIEEQKEAIALFKKEMVEKENELAAAKSAVSQLTAVLEKYDQMDNQLRLAQESLKESEGEKKLIREEMDSLREQVRYYAELPRRSMNESLLSVIDERDRSQIASPLNKSCCPESMGIVLDLQLREMQAELSSCKAVMAQKDEEIAQLRKKQEQYAELETELQKCKQERNDLLKKEFSTKEDLDQLKQRLTSFEEKVAQKNKELKENHAEMALFQATIDGRQQKYVKQISEIKRRVTEKENQLKSLETTGESLKRENLELFNELSLAQKQIRRLEEECKINEDSFKLERIHKERFKREVESLEAELKKLTCHQRRANTTLLVPTTVNVNGSNEAAAFIQAMSNSFQPDNYEINVNCRNVNKGLASSFLVADEEESEFMNPKNLSDMKEGRCNPKEHDVSYRMSTLQRRNTLMPPHLQSSYPIELQNVSIPAYTEDTVRKGRTAEEKAVVLRGIENHKNDAVDVLNSSIRSVKTKNASAIVQQTSSVSSHFLLSCTPSKLVRRVRSKQKWTPSKQK